MDLANHTVIPGLVGMHEHLFYPSGDGVAIYSEQAFSFPRLYLASGVTTARTGGSMEPVTDLRVKDMIDSGRMPGPRMYITGPYLEGAGTPFVQMHPLQSPEDARKTVEYWAYEGATSFKAYMHITRAELSAAVEAAHKLGVHVTGHLCSVGFREAAAIGIDNLEHGLVVDTEFDPGKKPDVCPPGSAQELAQLDVNGEAVQRTIHELGGTQSRGHFNARGFRRGAALSAAISGRALAHRGAALSERPRPPCRTGSDDERAAYQRSGI